MWLDFSAIWLDFKDMWLDFFQVTTANLGLSMTKFVDAGFHWRI